MASNSWLIPAGAGNMFCSCLDLLHGWAHPRGCGEHYMPISSISAAGGSSPRVRGTCLECIPTLVWFGLIPAGAGKTNHEEFLEDEHSAHPRRCGENTCSSEGCHIRVGSSPQVRGKPRLPKHRVVQRRLIPAGAGKTILVRSPPNCTPAHPRRCGEN